MCAHLGLSRFWGYPTPLGMPNPMINPSTGRVMNAYTLLRRTGPNANIQRTRVSVSTVANPDPLVSGQGIAGVNSTELGSSTTQTKAIGGF